MSITGQKPEVKPCRNGHDTSVCGRYKDGKCRACVRARVKAFRETHPDRVKASKTAWAKANPEKSRAIKLRFRHADPERTKRYDARWRDANRESVRERAATWARNNPDCGRQAESRRRAKKRNNPWAPYRRAEIFARYDSLCGYCAGLATCLDHIVPIHSGGADAEDNLIPACRSCNQRKTSKSLLVFQLTRRRPPRMAVRRSRFSSPTPDAPPPRIAR